MRPQIKIADFGYYGQKNVGDDLLQRSMDLMLQDCSKKIKADIRVEFISVLKSDPANKVFNLIHFYMTEYDLLIIGGGGLLVRSDIKCMLKYRLFLIRKKPYCFIGIGVNPISAFRRQFRSIFASSKVNIFRDEPSLANTNPADGANNNFTSVDLVLACQELLFPKRNNVINKQNDRKKRVYCICKSGENKEAFYISLLNQLAEHNFETYFIQFSAADSDFILRIKRSAEVGVIIASAENCCSVFEAINADDVIISERYHGIILSLIFGRLFIPVIYDPKTEYLLNRIGYKSPKYQICGESLKKNYSCAVPETMIELIRKIDRSEYEQFFRIIAQEAKEYDFYLEKIENVIKNVTKNE